MNSCRGGAAAPGIQPEGGHPTTQFGKQKDYGKLIRKGPKKFLERN